MKIINGELSRVQAMELFQWKIKPHIIIEEGSNCWIPSIAAKPRGYRLVWVNTDGYNGQFVLAHRITYLALVGEVTEYVLHHCDNPGCVNPKHLFQGTQSDNMGDASEKGRLQDLLEEQAFEVKKLLGEGTRASKLAREYNVSYKVIDSIKYERTWKHVQVEVE